MRRLESTFCFLLMALLAGCASPGGHGGGPFTGAVQDVDQLTEVLRDRLPPGTKSEDAVNFMQGEGFACKWEPNSTFRYKTINEDGTSNEHEQKDVDFWRCRRETTEGWVTTVMTVAVIIKDDEVAEILVNREFVGP